MFFDASPAPPLRFAVVLLLVAGCAHAPASSPAPAATQETPTMVQFHPRVRASIDAALADVDSIDPERKQQLDRLAAFIGDRIQAGQPVKLTFICTHNSRRSQLAQVWAAVAAAEYGIEQVQTFSGGTEATAFNPRAVAALRRAGFAIEDSGGDNPRYAVDAGPGLAPLQLFSKTFEHPENPQEGFAALMTCSDADQACPFVPGADFRLAIPYEDPKVADGTPEEAKRYDERSHQIATEMLYAFSRVGARK